MKDTINTKHINKLEEYIYRCLLKDELDLVQFIERISVYTNLKTIPKYAKDNGISYNGAKNNRKIIELFGVKFINDEN